MSYFRVCPECGAHLDPGEVCDCSISVSTGVRTDQCCEACISIAVPTYGDMLAGTSKMMLKGGEEE